MPWSATVRSGASAASATTVFLAVLPSLTACRAPEPASPPTALAPQDFRATPSTSPAPPPSVDAAVASADHAGPTPAPAPAPSARRQITRIPVMASSSGDHDGVVDVSSRIGRPALSDAAPPAAGRESLFDSLVGQVNGRPVFASTFLEPLQFRLRALNKDYPSRDAWLRAAAKVIADELEAKVNNDLLLAEAYAALSPEMKEHGLRYVLGQIRGELVRQNSGSEQAADQSLREGAEGYSLDQKARSELHRELQISEMRRRILPLVNVSSRDEQQYYLRNYEQFNPPGIATLRLIQVRADDSDAVAQVKEMLASGVPFAEVARLPFNAYSRESGGLREARVSGDYAAARFFGPDLLNQHAAALSPGQTVGPFEFVPAPGAPAYACWMHLERFERPPGISLYDAQLDIYNILYNQKLQAAYKRYFDALKRRGSYSDIQEMTARLLQIAFDRYYGAGT